MLLSSIPADLAVAFETTAPVRAVAGESILDDRQTRFSRLKFVYFDGLAFQRLVVLEETAQHVKPMARQFAGFPEAVVFGVIYGHCQNLVVLLAAVYHR